ncbi:hypothetical protein RHGRI_021954 [Rhododendron griersonianum]|uniref:Uncharacterized protein n=1 Tax=Rhododendron griersonianum TaxID=479676 RepID=A0AAV6JRC4_9ERIC|nr:hypothetical protein RHGRI_021954 [Rhododendron griersonianum]KAG5542260.1 hypothetical protein RHGRI_021954 [Rhododendron griersonianum]KAG5542261.1 hypothetical protein RHGRI_021954 [Rhododendron griersonianum]
MELIITIPIIHVPVQLLNYHFTAEGQKTIAVVAKRQETNQLTYEAHKNFVRDYNELLGLGDNLEWTFESNLVFSLEAVVRNRQFICALQYCVGRCWYFE